MAEAKFYTYIHRRLDNGVIFYVGKGWGYRCQDKNNRNKHWKNLTAKYGYAFEIVCRFIAESDAFAHERQLIAEYRRSGVALVNMTNGGEGQAGRVISIEQRAKISATLKARKLSESTYPANRGPLSFEHKAKISAAKKGCVSNRKGVVFTPEQRIARGWPSVKPQIITAPRLETHLTEAHKAKLSAALKGLQKAPFTKDHRAKMSESAKLRCLKSRPEI